MRFGAVVEEACVPGVRVTGVYVDLRRVSPVAHFFPRLLTMLASSTRMKDSAGAGSGVFVPRAGRLERRNC